MGRGGISSRWGVSEIILFSLYLFIFPVSIPTSMTGKPPKWGRPYTAIQWEPIFVRFCIPCLAIYYFVTFADVILNLNTPVISLCYSPIWTPHHRQFQI